MISLVIKYVKKILEDNGYDLLYIKSISECSEYNIEEDVENYYIQIEFLRLEYFKSFQKIQSEISDLKFKLIYLGERSHLPPSKSYICKLKPEEQERIKKKYNLIS